MRYVAFVPLLVATLLGQTPAPDRGVTGNNPERLEWFRDAGFGLFIHWSHDSQIGSVISHSMVGASEDYLRRFVEELPKTFNPRKFNPDDWAVLARLAGMKYVVFTTKHHSGFCMYDTKTTPFGIMNTPFKRDVTRAIVDAFRKQGLAVGFYFSPDDFWFLHRRGKPVARAPHPGVTPQENPALLEYDRAQLRELLTNYGAIDLLFLDGPAEGLKELAWELQPNIVVTRGAIETPEQRIPGVPMDRPWEACITMGTQWQYKPTHESYKSGTKLLEILIETRAKGGNLLLNVGPKPDGELPIEQEERLREIALWNFAYGESLDGVRPWVISNEGPIYFTRKKNADTVYAIITGDAWTLGQRRSYTLRSVKSTPKTTISLLGHDNRILEYRPDVDARTEWRQDAGGLHVTPMMAQRLYNDRRWPNPVVLKITHAQPGLTPPRVTTRGGERQLDGASAALRGLLDDLGHAATVEVGFEYRRRKRTEELYEQDAPWQSTALTARSAPGEFSATVDGLKPDREYEIRAVVKHPLVTVYGEEATLGAAKRPSP